MYRVRAGRLRVKLGGVVVFVGQGQVVDQGVVVVVVVVVWNDQSENFEKFSGVVLGRSPR